MSQLRDVVTSMEEFIFERLHDLPSVPFGGRIFPGMAPAGTQYPLLTFDLGYSEPAAGGIGSAAGRFFSQRWEFDGWVQGQTRLPVRLEFEKVFDALLKEDGSAHNWQFTSALDGGVWDITVMYYGPMTNPSRVVDDEGTYGRVTHAFRFDVNLVS